MATTIQYTTMIVQNMDETLSFYKSAFGFDIEGEFNPNENTRIVIIKDFSGKNLELIESSMFDTGLYSVGLDVDDLEDTVSHLKTLGYDITAPIVPTLVGRMTFVKDPNGINIALIEHNLKYALK